MERRGEPPRPLASKRLTGDGPRSRQRSSPPWPSRSTVTPLRAARITRHCSEMLEPPPLLDGRNQLVEVVELSSGAVGRTRGLGYVALLWPPLVGVAPLIALDL